MLSKYLKPVVSFRSLPDDLQNSIIMRGLFSILIGLFVIAFGIASKSAIFRYAAILSEIILVFFFFMPYFLATRDKIVQVSGICIRKDEQGYLIKKTGFYFIYIHWEDREIAVSVNKKIYRHIQAGLPVNIYVLPKNILPKGNGYLISDPLFVLQPEGFVMQPMDSDKQDLQK